MVNTTKCKWPRTKQISEEYGDYSVYVVNVIVIIVAVATMIFIVGTDTFNMPLRNR